jgi:hypothetical protein
VIVARVVPVMEERRRQDLLEDAQPHLDVGVDEVAPERADEEHQGGNQGRVRPDGGGQAGGVEQDEPAHAREHQVDGVGPGVDEVGHVFGAVMHGVEAP